LTNDFGEGLALAGMIGGNRPCRGCASGKRDGDCPGKRGECSSTGHALLTPMLRICDAAAPLWRLCSATAIQSP
jgi:hypothetical protein